MSLLFDFATKNLHLATSFYHLVAKWRLNNFFNFEACLIIKKENMYIDFLLTLFQKEMQINYCIVLYCINKYSRRRTDKSLTFQCIQLPLHRGLGKVLNDVINIKFYC